jgi:acyl carrier protein
MLCKVMEMEINVSQTGLNHDVILQDLIQILQDITSDWDMEFNCSMGKDTKLIGDLAFESIDVVQFIVAIEEHYKRRGLPYEEFLMVDGRYVDEIKIGDVATFLDQHLNAT